MSIRSFASRLFSRLASHLDETQRRNTWTLMYVLFLFINFSQQPWTVWLPPTLASLAIFLPLYLKGLCLRGRRVLYCAAVFAALGLALTPVNGSANTYLIYAAVMLPLAGMPLTRAAAVIAAGLGVYALELWLLGWSRDNVTIVVGITAIVSFTVCAANHFQVEKQLRQAELKLSHEEVRRLAATAERERIGRDLHDLLGHTLSLIAIKSELAGKLFERDPHGARREVLEVENVARDALGQVRRAVSGIRAAGLVAELVSAKLLLESSGVGFSYSLDEVALPADAETALALCVREAVTNIQRHARASHASASLAQLGDTVALAIVDDGRGGALVPGNGLTGMRERLEEQGGELRVESVRGSGTRIELRVPLTTAPQPVAPGAVFAHPAH
jgi:two-component system sensor histidine kinase DesK